MNQRYTISTPSGETHIYMEPNLPEQNVIDTLDEKLGTGWHRINYNSNIIHNPSIKKMGGISGVFSSIKKSVGSATKKIKPLALRAGQGVGDAGKKAWKGVKKAGQYAWESAEDMAPDLYEKAGKGGEKIVKGAGSAINDLFSYGATKLEQYQKYQLLQTKQAKKEFTEIMKKFEAGVLKHNGKAVTEFRKALSLAVNKAYDTEAKMTKTLTAKRGAHVIVFDKWDVPDKRIYNYAKEIKDKYPKVWDLGGNIFGNTAFKNLERVINRGYWLDKEEWMYKKWQSFIRRHAHNKRIEGKVALLKWLSWGNGGREQTEELVDNAIKHLYNRNIYSRGASLRGTKQSASVLDLQPLGEIPLSTQLQRLTGDTYNIHDFESENGKPLDAIEGNVIVHKKTGAKFRIPFSDSIADNGKGGFNYSSEDAVKTAEKYDLLTLPANVKGTNCANCTFYLSLNKAKGHGFCYHHSIMLQVTSRMCCALWNNLEATRQWTIFQDGGEVPYNPFDEKPNWEKKKSWITATLTNDETSTDEELVNYFISEGKMKYEEAKHYVSQRDKFLKEMQSKDALVKWINPDDETRVIASEPFSGETKQSDSASDPQLETIQTIESPSLEYYQLLDNSEPIAEETTLIEEGNNTELPTQEEVSETLLLIPDAENHYLNDKEVAEWDRHDIDNYNALRKQFAKDQFQAIYDASKDDSSNSGLQAGAKEAFVKYVQESKEKLIPNQFLVIHLGQCNCYHKIVDALSKHGYLKVDESAKYNAGGVVIKELLDEKSESTKLYELKGDFGDKIGLVYFKVHFVPQAQPGTAKFIYKPDSVEVWSVMDKQGDPIDFWDIPLDTMEEIQRIAENFRLTQADASDWHTKYNDGGYLPSKGSRVRSTGGIRSDAELRQIGASILADIGAGTLKKADAHSYAYGYNKYPFVTFKLGSDYTYKEIIIWHNTKLDAFDVSIKKVQTFPNYQTEVIESIDGVYADALTSIVEEAGKEKFNEGGTTSTTKYYKVEYKTLDDFAEFLNELKPFTNTAKVYFAGIGEAYLIVNGFYDDSPYSSDKEDFHSVISKNFGFRYKTLNSKPAPETRWEGKWRTIDETLAYLGKPYEHGGPIAQGIKVEKEHRDLYLDLKKRLKDKGIEMPISEHEFYAKIAGAHIKESPKYYELLEEMEKQFEHGGEPQGIIWHDEWRVDYFPKSRVPYYFNSKETQINLSTVYLTRTQLDEIVKKYMPSAEVREEDDMYKIVVKDFDVINNYEKIDEAFKNTIQYRDGGIIKPNQWQYRVMWSFRVPDKDWKLEVWETYSAKEALNKWYEVTILPNLELAMLDMNMFNEQERVIDHRSLKMWPKYAHGGNTHIPLYQQGGKIIGYTGTGKPVYDKYTQAPTDYIDSDFKDAGNIHSKLAKKTKNNPELKEQYQNYALAFYQMYQQMKMAGSFKLQHGGTARMGGFAQGPSHDDGGIPGIVKSTGQAIEFEGDEAIINKTNMRDTHKYAITKPMTLKEMASCVNEVNGNGVNFREDDTPCPIKKVD